MQKKTVKTIKEYLETLSSERKSIVNQLRRVIKKNLPQGFKEEINYGMIGYVVPLTIYPPGYRNNTPLPFMNIASQKNNVVVYHLGVYSDKKLLAWFKKEYEKFSKRKLDMGKSCIRFKHLNEIPYSLIGELSSKISVKKWIEIYESAKKK